MKVCGLVRHLILACLVVCINVPVHVGVVFVIFVLYIGDGRSLMVLRLVV